MNHYLKIILFIKILLSGVRYILLKKRINLNNSKIITMFQSFLITFFLSIFIITIYGKKAIIGEFKNLNREILSLMVLSAVIITIAIIISYELLEKLDISTYLPIFKGLNIVLLSFIGYMIFNEKMTIKKILGSGLIVGGAYLLSKE